MIGLRTEIRCDEPGCPSAFVLTSPHRPVITAQQFAADHHLAYALAGGEGWRRVKATGVVHCPDHVAA